MKILLDIDGVMVQAKPWKSPILLKDGFPMFTHMATKSLNKIIHRYNPSILLTTSHRNRFGIEEWKIIFKIRGLEIERLDRTAPSNFNSSRKEEILNWFNTTKFSGNFLIIDDDKSLNGLPSFYKKRLIQPSPYIGLTSHLIDEAIDSLEAR